MLKDIVRRLLVTLLCFSFIAPMIPEFTVLSVKATNTAPDLREQDTPYKQKTEDNDDPSAIIDKHYNLLDKALSTDYVYAGNYFPDIISKVNANIDSSSSMDILTDIKDYLGSLKGDPNRETQVDGDGFINVSNIKDDVISRLEMIPVRITSIVYDGGKIKDKIDVGAISVLGYKITSSGVSIINVKFCVVGIAGSDNYAELYVSETKNIPDAESSESFIENVQKVKYNYSGRDPETGDWITKTLQPTKSDVKLHIYSNLLDELYLSCSDGYTGYMSNVGYNPEGSHIGADPFKELVKSDYSNDAGSQILDCSVEMDYSKLSSYAKNRIDNPEYTFSVTLGGEDSDHIHVGEDGKLVGLDDEGKAFRKFANDVIAGMTDSCSDDSERDKYLSNWKGGNCFICKYIESIVNAVDDWNVSLDSAAIMKNQLQIFDEFHMVEQFMYNSINYCYGTMNNPNTTITFYDVSGGTVGDSRTVELSQVEGMFKSLTPYQQASLARTYTSIIGSNTKMGDYFFDFMYIKSEGRNIGSFTYENKTGGTEPNIDEEDLKFDIKQFENSTYTPSDTPIDVARYADLIARYCYITSVKYRADIDEEDAEIYSVWLETLGSAMWSNAMSAYKNNKDFSLDIMQMPEDVMALEDSYGWLVDDSINAEYDSSDYAFNRMQTILYGVSYAFLVTAKSEFAEVNGYSPSSLRSWIRGDGEDDASKNYNAYFTWLDDSKGMSVYDSQSLLAKKDFPAENSDISIWMFQCIISLHDLCEHFDIDPSTWNKDIYEYYMIYEDNKDLFEALRNNAVFMGIGYTGGNTAQNPLGRLFSIQDKKMSDNWMRGFALSSQFTPMVTNLYDSSTYDYLNDGDWMTEYFYRYGFHRKALYISTDPNIVVNSKVGRTSSNGRKVCTLSDLLNYDRDIELYVDTSFYNADDIAEGLGRVDYATIRSMVEEQALQSTQGSEAAEQQQASQSKAADDILKGTVYNRNYVDETLNLDTATLLKDDGVTTYSTDVAQHVTKFGETADLSTSLYDAYVLSADSIVDAGTSSVFDLYQYSALLGYGVVSAIYRDTQMFNTIMAATSADTTVFRSSKNIVMAEDSTYKDWLSYFNYIMLGNLEKQMNVNVDSLLDLNAPVFIDLFGNIVTESGYVIIPAAANPTLCGINWNPYCIGFASYLNNLNEVILTTDCTPQFLTWITGTEYTTVDLASINGETTVELKGEVDSIDLTNYSGTGGWFIVDKHGRVILKNVELRSNGLSSIVSWSTLNAHSDVILKIFFDDAYYKKAMKMYGAKMIMLTTEVLRGAPVETIDYEKEGLSNVAKGEAGIVIAYALDNIFDAISTRGSSYVNSMLTMPNLALQPYLKYIIYFGIKICVLVMVVLLMLNLFKSGIQGRIGFKYVLSFVFTTIIVCSAIYILPSSIKWSYDNANAKLLSTEACDIVLYDAMRNSEGQQIGITNVTKIDECTELYMEVGKVHVNWQNVLTKGLLTNEYTSFQDIFDDAMVEDPMANQWGVTNKGSSLYMSTRDIYDSTRIVYNAQTNTLSSKLYSTLEIAEVGSNAANSGSEDEINTYAQRDTGAAVYSFVSPYYAFLDMIIANINDYNQSHDIKSYNFSADKYGGVITYDVASPYLLSDEFLYDGFDILGLYQIMRSEQQKPSNVYIFSAEDIARMSMSEWYDLDLTEEQKVKKIEQVYDYARAFVSDHRAVLKHIPDSMYIKALAFACAVKYNQVFNAPHADSVKMLQVDNRDIMRFMLGDFYTVYSNYPYTFGRFVYKSAGTAGVLLSLILSVIILVSNVIKPVLIAVMFVLIILNICFRELLLNKPNRGVEGYFIGCGLFIVINLVYALLLKLTMIFANTGYPVVLAIIVAIVVQLLYMAALMALIWIQLSEWKDLGFGKMQNMMMHLGGFIGGRHGYGRGFGRGFRRGYGGYGAYGGYGSGYGLRRRSGFRRNQYNPYGGYEDYDDHVIGVQLSNRDKRKQRRMNDMRTVDDMYARDEERQDNAFRRRGRR